MNSGQKEVAARVNASIICKEVRLIDADGNMIGIVSPEKANIMAVSYTHLTLPTSVTV